MRCLILIRAYCFYGALGMSGGDWVLLSCHSSVGKYYHEMQQSPSFWTHQIISNDEVAKEKVLMPLDLDVVEATC